MVKDRPVQASKARLWVTIQSTEPLRFTTAKEVVGVRTEMRAVTGLVEETWGRSMGVSFIHWIKICHIPSGRETVRR